MEAKQQVLAKSLKDSSLPASEKAALDEKLQRAAKLIRFVRVARGEHNIYLSSLALRRADAALNDAGSKMSASSPDLSSLPLLSGSYCATLCHVKIGVHVPPETVRVFGKVMPHKMHAEMMGCVQCHDIGAHKKVPLRKEWQQKCRECHDKQP
jgi:hypothetical protein